MKPPISLPPRLYFALLGIVLMLFAATVGGVVALSWTGKPIPPELGKAFSALGAILGYGLMGAHPPDGADGAATPSGDAPTEVLPGA